MEFINEQWEKPGCLGYMYICILYMGLYYPDMWELFKNAIIRIPIKQPDMGLLRPSRHPRRLARHFYHVVSIRNFTKKIFLKEKSEDRKLSQLKLVYIWS